MITQLVQLVGLRHIRRPGKTLSMHRRTVMWITALSVFVGIGVGTILALSYFNIAASPSPDFAVAALRNEESLLRMAKAGDAAAGNELASAYLFELNPNRAKEILRLVLARRSDTETERLLGSLLLNSVLRDLDHGKTPDGATQSEALALLRLATLKGSREAAQSISIYEQKLHSQSK